VRSKTDSKTLGAVAMHMEKDGMSMEDAPGIMAQPARGWCAAYGPGVCLSQPPPRSRKLGAVDHVCCRCMHMTYAWKGF
jgi:hypothetical protein